MIATHPSANGHLTTYCATERPAAECWAFACRASSWRGPNGETPADLRYSACLTLERRFRVGMRRPRPDELPDTIWVYRGRERCEDEGECWFAWKYTAAMDWPAFALLMDSFPETEGGSGGYIDPDEAEGHWAPAVSARNDSHELLYATAWRRDRPNDDHRFDDWDAVKLLLAMEQP